MNIFYPQFDYIGDRWQNDALKHKELFGIFVSGGAGIPRDDHYL